MLSGCASMFTAKTRASFVMPDGTRAEWESDKEHEGLEAEYDPKSGRFKISVMRSGTSESAIAATAQTNLKIAELLGSALKASGKVP